MPVRIHPRTHVIVLALSGELDLVSQPLLDAAVDSALRGGWKVLVADLAELTFIDVAGAGPLTRLAESLSSARQLMLVNASPPVETALTALGLQRWLVALEQLPLTSDAELAELLGS